MKYEKIWAIADNVTGVTHWTGNEFTGKNSIKAEMDPVEVEEPLKWSFETHAREDEMGQNWLGVPAWQSAPSEIDEGNWRHEVVSTRIG